MSEQQFVQISRRGKISEDEFFALIPALNKKKWQMILPPQLEIEELTGKRTKNIITPADSPIPDCQTCGACCVFFLCVAVNENGYQTPPEYVWQVTREAAGGEITVDRFMRRDEEKLNCTALVGTLGENVGCGIYENRPQVCRDFEAGSDKCHALRRAYGIEHFLSLGEMMTAQEKVKANEAQPVSSETIHFAKIREQDGTRDLEIVAVMEDESIQQLHVYNRERENWGQSEFIGITLDEARRLIDSRTNTANRN